MFQSLAPRWRRLLNSLVSSALVVLVVGLGYLTFRVVSERRHRAESGEPAGAQAAAPLIDVNAFWRRVDKSSDAERLTVSVRLRLSAPGSLDCYVFVVARNDHVSPRLWGVWPTQGPGGALTAGGHLGGGSPASGAAVRLTNSWTRVTATIDHPLGRPPFETAMVYVVTSKGEILLARPFAL
jgi:hypothetical protein